MWKVSYLHYLNTYGNPYRVARTFDSKADAEKFISDNALVCPLPGVRLEEI